MHWNQNICYNLAVAGKKEITVGMRVDDETKRLLDKIVEFEDRKIGYVSRELMLRGLDLYLKDGQLRKDSPRREAVDSPSLVVPVASDGKLDARTAREKKIKGNEPKRRRT
jgi:hypothetical protein